MMTPSQRFLTLLSTSVLLGLSTLHATEHSAKEIIQKAFAHTSSLKSYAFTAHTSEKETLEDGSFATYLYTTNVEVKRPSQLRIDTKSKYLNRTMLANNGLFTVMRHSDNTYSQLKVPKNIDEAIEAVLHKYALHKAPLAALVYSDVSKHIKLHKGTYVASEMLEDVKCDHLRFTRKKRTVDVWVTQSKKPQIVAYNIHDSETQPPVFTKTKITWKEKAANKERDFVFKAPRGSKKVEIVTEDAEG